MKKIAIAALSAMLFIGVSCSKDKALKPIPTLDKDYRNDEVVNPYTNNAKTITSGTTGRERTVGNANVINPYHNTERWRRDIRNDEEINPNTGTARWRYDIRNDENTNPNIGTDRWRRDIRNDEVVNPNSNTERKGNSGTTPVNPKLSPDPGTVDNGNE